MQISSIQSKCKVFSVILMLLVTLFILKPFISAIIWSIILSITFFPLFKKIENRTSSLAASSLTIIAIIAIVVLPLLYLITSAGQEIPGLIELYKNMKMNGFPLPHQLDKFPKIHGYLTNIIAEHTDKKPGNMSFITHYGFDYIMKFTHKLGEVSEAIFIALMTTFFILLYNNVLICQLKKAGDYFLGEEGESLALKAIIAVKGAVAGLVFVGLGEGIICVPIMFITHVPHAAILSISLGIAAIIPFCAPIVLIGICLYTLCVVSATSAIIVAVGCMIILFAGDHFVRPKLIGSANKMPFLVVMLAILGGLHAFGILGLFVGPAVFTVMLTLWKAITEEKTVNSETDMIECTTNETT